MKASTLFRSFEGPLTSSLVREPGKFGLGQLPKKLSPQQTTSSVCGYCSVGCSLSLHIKDGKAVNLSPNKDYPVNLGMACPKGWDALNPIRSPERAKTPLSRNSRGEAMKAIDWEEASNIFCERFKKIQSNHGQDSIAFLSTGQICTEELALLGAFTKFGMGIKHGDGNTRQCMATSVVAYKESFGFDAPPYSYSDFEESDVIILIGSNLCIAHPILWQRILRNKRDPKIIVIDPRLTETAMQSTMHVPLAPKSDLTLFYGLANLLIKNNYLAEDFIKNSTSGFENFRDFVEQFTPNKVSEITGISITLLNQLTEIIGTNNRVSFWWTMGVNQGYESTRTAQSIINLALMTGNIGRPGTGANSITGQCNAMGSRLFSNTTNLLGGHDFREYKHRKKISNLLGVPIEKIPSEPSWAYDQIIDGIESGKIKGLWIIATNGAHSWTNQKRFKKILDKLEFLVVQDLYSTTETAEFADLFLPASGWAEKEGTFINSERRIGHIKKVLPAPGIALSDFSIFRLLAKKWNCESWINKWNSPESVFNILKKISSGQPCDITGIEDYSELDKHGGIQWPISKTDSSDIKCERRLFSDGLFYTKTKKAFFVYEQPKSNPEKPTKEFPYVLMTGRGTSAQWHTGTRTGKSNILKKMYPEKCYLEINEFDAIEKNIDDGDIIIISSTRGTVSATAFVTNTVNKGQAFMPMHYEETNILTNQIVDPYSRQPNYKGCSINYKKIKGTCK